MFGEMTFRERVAWAAIVLLGIAARVINVDRWPGINGDESWYGVNVQELLHGGAAFFHTGVGNPLNPIHSGLLLPLSAIFPPSAWVLRAPEVILGVALVILAFPMTVRAIGSRAALIFTTLIAIAPAAVMYSRLGWDPSGTPLLTFLVIAWALDDKPEHALVALGAAYLVHPTNIFVAPIALAAWLPFTVERYRNATKQQKKKTQQIAITALVAVAALAGWVLYRAHGNPSTSLPSIAMVTSRIKSPAAWWSLVSGVSSLVSGVASATYIAGPLPGMAGQLATGLTMLALLVPIGIGIRSVVARWPGIWLMLGITASLAAFLIVAGPEKVQPGVERYALFFLVPILLLGAIGMAVLAETQEAMSTAAVALVSISMVAVLGAGYFYPLATSGGASEATYRTGAIEPKLAAFKFIERDSAKGPVTVIADDWWIYWTMRYFASAGGRILVEPAPGVAIPGGTRPPGAKVPKGGLGDLRYIVTFAGTATDAAQSRLGRKTFTATDPLNRPIVRVYRVTP